MTDQKLEVFIGNLLRAGVLTAAIVVAFGAVLYLAQNHSEKASYGTFQREDASLRTIPGIIGLAARFDSKGLIQFGILLLIATPVARVAFAAAGFYLERDFLYVLVSLIVLGILIYSMAHAT